MVLGQCQEPAGAGGLPLVLIPFKQLSNSQLFEPWKYIAFSFPTDEVQRFCQPARKPVAWNALEHFVLPCKIQPAEGKDVQVIASLRAVTDCQCFALRKEVKQLRGVAIEAAVLEHHPERHKGEQGYYKDSD